MADADGGLIEVERASVRFGAQPVLRDVSLTIPHNQTAIGRSKTPHRPVPQPKSSTSSGRSGTAGFSADTTLSGARF